MRTQTQSKLLLSVLPQLRSLLLGLGVLVSSASALAYPEYPYALQSELDTACTPRCGTCHSTEPGRAGTAKNEPFVRTLSRLDQNVVSGDEDALISALSQLGDTDTDGDGFSDIDELTADPPSDPNSEALTPDQPDVGMCGAVVKYGCGARIAPAETADSPWGVLSLALAFGAMWLSRRKRVKS